MIILDKTTNRIGESSLVHTNVITQAAYDDLVSGKAIVCPVQPTIEQLVECLDSESEVSTSDKRIAAAALGILPTMQRHTLTDAVNLVATLVVDYRDMVLNSPYRVKDITPEDIVLRISHRKILWETCRDHA